MLNFLEETQYGQLKLLFGFLWAPLVLLFPWLEIILNRWDFRLHAILHTYLAKKYLYGPAIVIISVIEVRHSFM